jgi:hypothetical protein
VPYSNRLSYVHYSVYRDYNHLSSILCLAILQPSIRYSTLPIDMQLTICSTDYARRSLLRYSNPTILCALLCLPILQPTILCTLPDDIATEYPPLNPACRYYNYLYALPTLRSTLSGVTPTDYAVYTTLLALLQLTICSTDDLLCSLWR